MLKKILLGAVLLGVMAPMNAVWAGEMPAAAVATVDNAVEAPQAPAAVQASSSCGTFKWNRTCSSTSEQECQASCGSCTMCLNVIQFYPCVYECSCAC